MRSTGTPPLVSAHPYPFSFSKLSSLEQLRR
jgi:hypothetical protein